MVHFCALFHVRHCYLCQIFCETCIIVFFRSQFREFNVSELSIILIVYNNRKFYYTYQNNVFKRENFIVSSPKIFHTFFIINFYFCIWKSFCIAVLHECYYVLYKQVNVWRSFTS